VDFDFRSQFRHYTIQQLLDIVERADNYQPAAVAAANELLLQQDAVLVARARERMYPVPDRLEEASVDSIFAEGPSIYDPRHLAIVKGLLIALQFILSGRIIWQAIPFLASIGTFETGFIIASLLPPAVTILAHLTTALLLWRSLVPGWYLGMIHVLYNLATRLSLILFFITSDVGYNAEGLFVTNGLDVSLNSSVVFLLWIPLTRDTFNVSARNRNWTVGIVLGLGFAFTAYRYYSFFG
jgi:hypothetical protein